MPPAPAAAHQLQDVLPAPRGLLLQLFRRSYVCVSREIETTVTERAPARRSVTAELSLACRADVQFRARPAAFRLFFLPPPHFLFGSAY